MPTEISAENHRGGQQTFTRFTVKWEDLPSTRRDRHSRVKYERVAHGGTNTSRTTHSTGVGWWSDRRTETRSANPRNIVPSCGNFRPLSSFHAREGSDLNFLAEGTVTVGGGGILSSGKQIKHHCYHSGEKDPESE